MAQPIRFLAHWPRKGPPEMAVCRGSPEADLPVATSKLENQSRERSTDCG